jgi:hypothetical protein
MGEQAICVIIYTPFVACHLWTQNAFRKAHFDLTHTDVSYKMMYDTFQHRIFYVLRQNTVKNCITKVHHLMDHKY